MKTLDETLGTWSKNKPRFHEVGERLLKLMDAGAVPFDGKNPTAMLDRLYLMACAQADADSVEFITYKCVNDKPQQDMSLKIVGWTAVCLALGVATPFIPVLLYFAVPWIVFGVLAWVLARDLKPIPVRIVG